MTCTNAMIAVNQFVSPSPFVIDDIAEVDHIEWCEDPNCPLIYVLHSPGILSVSSRNYFIYDILNDEKNRTMTSNNHHEKNFF